MPRASTDLAAELDVELYQGRPCAFRITIGDGTDDLTARTATLRVIHPDTDELLVELTEASGIVLGVAATIDINFTDVQSAAMPLRPCPYFCTFTDGSEEPITTGLMLVKKAPGFGA